MSWPLIENDTTAPGCTRVSTIGTDWKNESPLPGARPMRSNCAFRYAVVMRSPGPPGERPSNSSEARVWMWAARSAAVIAGSKVCGAAGDCGASAATGAGAGAGSGAGAGTGCSRWQAASARTASKIVLRRIGRLRVR